MSGYPIQRRAGRRWEDLPGSPWGALLWPAAGVFAAAAALRSLAYDRGWLASTRLGVPVISLGNLTAGGTGKTPATIRVAALLRGLGRRPAVIARGYRAAANGRNEEAELLGDVPVVCDPDRVAGGRQAITAGADCLVLDDGFQHRRLHRDLDIVLIDATRPWGAADGGPGRPLPAGYRREFRSAIRRAGLLWITRADLVPADRLEGLRRSLSILAPGIPMVEERLATAELTALERGGGGAGEPVAAWAGRPVVLASGIGNPQAFEAQAEALGLVIRTAVRFPDHHHFTAADAQELAAQATARGAALVVTAKDAVKLARLPVPPVAWILAATGRLSDDEPLRLSLARAIGSAG